MIRYAANGTLPIRNTGMDYIRFGNGPKTLVMLPGLGDGLRTVKGAALPMAFMYRKFASKFTVYAFSRINDLPAEYTTHDMAQDQAAAMKALGIENACVLGVSMGGMIAQHLAAEYPALVNKLILTVTSVEPTPVLTASVKEWKQLASQGNHTALMDSNLKRMYSESYYRRNRWLVPFVGKLTKPKTYDRFFTQANACLSHNAIDKLPRIACPTLVIGGEQDRVVSPGQSRKIASLIPNAQLHMYADHGHSLYEEANDFESIVLDFFGSASIHGASA